MLLADPAVKAVGSRLGTSRTGSSGFFNIELKTMAEGRKETTFAVLDRLSAKADRFPDLNLRLRPIQDLPTGGGGGSSQGGQYSVSLKGDDVAELQEWVPKLVDALKKNPMLRDVGSDIDAAGLRQNMVIDRDTAARLGIGVGDIDGALYNAFGQRAVSTIYSDINQYRVIINALPQMAATPEALNQIYVRSATSGAMIPISAVTRQEPGLAPTQIVHEDQYTSMSVSFNLAPNVSMGEAMEIIQKTVEGMRMPGSIRLDTSTSFGRFQQAQSNMPLLILAAIVVVYLLMGMLYESLIHPVTIISTLPAAGVGALAALVITDTELSVVAMIALVLLIGIVKKNAIMMIDFALVAQRDHALSYKEAIREACLVRFRPIMMTTMVAILAATPLAIGLGEGSELRRPLGIAMIGGLVISQSLTLLSTPALYVIFACLSERWKARKARRLERRRQAVLARDS
jgi:multidrug efflux pump